MRSSHLEFHYLLFSFFAFLAFGFTAKSWAQSDFSFRQLSVNDGLSQNSAISVTQDGEGFLWIATQEGLNKYDGRQFQVYNKKFNDVTQPTQLVLGKVFADSKNRIWIIPDTTVPELLYSKTGQFESVFGVTAATQIFEDIDGKIWLSTQSGQLYIWNEEIHNAELFWSDPSKEIVNISDYDSNTLLLTCKSGVFKFRKTNKELIPILVRDDLAPFSVAKVTDSNLILIGTLKNGLWILDKVSGKQIPAENLLDSPMRLDSHQMIVDILIDSQNRIWIASYGNGAYLLDLQARTIENFTYSKQNPRSIYYNDILCLFEDYTQTVWLGSDGAGLSYYDVFLEKFNFFHNQQVPENVNIDVVRAIYADAKGMIYLGTSGKGMTIYDSSEDSWQTHTFHANSNSKLSGNRIMSLLGIGDELWIGYQNSGLSIWNTQNGKVTHFNETSEPKLSSKTIWKIFQDSQGRIWLGTRNSGLIMFDSQLGEIEKFTNDPQNPESIPDNNIREIIEFRPNEFWIGTENQGIAHFNLLTRKFTSIKSKDDNTPGLSSNHIKSLFIDKNDHLWIGTNGGGLNQMNLESKTFKVYNTDNGLANNVIYGILSDENQNLWLSSNRGISQIKLIAGEPSEIINYTNYDGLATEFNTGAYFKDENGTLYFGSLEGFYWFKSGDIKLNNIAPKTAISSIYSFDTTIPIQNKFQLPSDQSTLIFNIASLAFSSPKKNQYQYMLKGYDDDWNFNGNNNQARYTNLSPGEYTFLAKSSNYDGIWSETPVSFEFVILPPWYKSLWAKLLYVLLIILGIYATYRYIIWRIYIQYELKSRQEETKRWREMDQFKSSFFTDISHEFRTPLTLIMGPTQRLINQSDNPIFRSQLNLIQHNSKRLLSLVDQLLEASKLKSGTLNLKVKRGNLSLLLQTIAVNFYYATIEKEMDLETEIPLITEVWFDPDKVEKVVGNLLQNALKYGKPNTTINLKCFVEKNRIFIQVQNFSSKKYDEKELAQLFEKFYKPDPKSEGFGIGLPMVKDLVGLHNGKIELNFQQESGLFAVMVSIPIDKFSYSPDQIWEDEITELKGTVENPSFENPDINQPLVLIVEDNKRLREFITQELHDSYQILQAENGREGVYLALKHIPDLVISDVMMPELDGITLCKNLKKDEKTSHIPIILLTAKVEEENMIKGLQNGADDYIYKPFSIKTLLIRIEKLIELRRNLRIRYSEKPQINPKEMAITSADEKFLNKVQEIVGNDLLDVNFSIEEFCRILGMSRMQLHRKLTALTGLSTTAFIRDQRLRKALQKLEKTDETISEIAYSVGFSSPSYFIKCFRETYQMTPTEYQISKNK